jgi:ribosome production factor 1
MGSRRPVAGGLASGVSINKITGNKIKRQQLWAQQKKIRDKEKREARFARKKEEDKNPELRAARLERNKPATIDRKRVWDNVDDDGLYARVDVQKLAQRRLEDQERAEQEALEAQNGMDMDEEKEEEVDDDDGEDSMLGSGDEAEEEAERQKLERKRAKRAQRDTSAAPSTTSTSLDLTPSSLYAKFPTLFTDLPAPTPKILVTTSLNSTLHNEANLLCTLFPNSNYIPRSAHRYSHKYSLREISRFAANREYTAIVMLREDQKKPYGLTIVHLPSGPTFTFSISNWMEGRKLPGHGNPTNHYPELLLNNFKTPLGLLTAKLFFTLFPPRPEFQGRQVVTLHNQRDYIFVRRHRYVFRDKRETEKNILDAEGKEMKGVEGIRTGLQELGPRFTLKLRRVDKGIGRAGSEGEDAVQWEWKTRMENDRKVFNL